MEDVLSEIVEDSETDAYVFRPCIVAGPEAPLLINAIPYVQLSERLPGAVRALFDQVPILKPVLPDPGVPFQLVHHDDVALALRAAVLGRGTPGVYNLAGAGEVTMRDLADALGYYTVPGARAGRRCHGRGDRATAVPARRGVVDRGRAHPGPHGHGEGALTAQLAPAPRRARDAQGDRRGTPPRPQRLISPGATIAR